LVCGDGEERHRLPQNRRDREPPSTATARVLEHIQQVHRRLGASSEHQTSARLHPQQAPDRGPQRTEGVAPTPSLGVQAPNRHLDRPGAKVGNL
jgi:hypothetical protein